MIGERNRDTPKLNKIKGISLFFLLYVRYNKCRYWLVYVVAALYVIDKGKYSVILVPIGILLKESPI